MASKIAAFDWRADSATLDAQITGFNSFLATRTLDHVVIADEFVVANYRDVVPANPTKVKVFHLLDELEGSSFGAVEIIIDNFLSGKTLLQLITMPDTDRGAFLVLYEE